VPQDFVLEERFLSSERSNNRVGDRVVILMRVVQGREEDEVGPQLLLEVLEQKHDLSSMLGELAVGDVERVRLCADDC